VFETIIRGGRAVLPSGVENVDIAIADGRIQSIGPDLPSARREIDARGLHILPGIIDIHVHFNEPGRTEWEGAATGSAALAAGGGTMFFDMPLNSTPCTVNPEQFDRKARALSQASIADFGLWGGLVPDSISHMEELASRGVIGFKAFLCDSGLPEFPRADDGTLYRGLQMAAKLNLPVAVHAENHEITTALARRLVAEGLTEIPDFLASRPVLAEVEAIQRAALFAGELGAKLHVVHVSTGRGVAAAVEARARGVDVSIETCPHYLFFTDADLERLGASGKCAPPLRSSADRDALWDQVLAGAVDHVASDHSPAPPDMKSGPFWRAWGGIAGVQSTLSILLDQGFHRRGLALHRIAELAASNGARRYRIPSKGRIEPGYDADLALVDLSAEQMLQASDLLQRHAISPYIGSTFRGIVLRTLRRGEIIFQNGATCATTKGRLVRPTRCEELSGRP
jgi:allantoinase